MVQSASDRGFGLAFRGLVSHRASIASSAVSFFIFKLCVWFRPSRGSGGFVLSLFILTPGLPPAAVSRFRFFSFAFGVGRSRVCVGFVFGFTCSSVSYSNHSFKLTMF